MSKTYAFIDECGNTGLDLSKQGTSTHFIIAAIIIKEENIDELKAQVEAIRKTFFQSGEMKSSRLNDSRRRRILDELLQVDYKYYALVVDKAKVFRESGLVYKATFIKHLHAKLYDELVKAYPDLHIVADEHGTPEFMQSFKQYVISKNEITLLTPLEGQENFYFEFRDSKDSALIQLADIVAGTLSFAYEESKDKNVYNLLKAYLKSKEIIRQIWPEKRESLVHKQDQSRNSKVDRAIYKYSVQLALSYIAKNQDERDPGIVERVFVLKFLLSDLSAFYGDAFITSGEIISHLEKYTGNECTGRHFRTAIIAKLRDASVLIASSRDGYKISTSLDDIYCFVDTTNQKIQPMFSRLEKARTGIKVATEGEVDILEKEEYKKLKSFLDNN